MDKIKNYRFVTMFVAFASLWGGVAFFGVNSYAGLQTPRLQNAIASKAPTSNLRHNVVYGGEVLTASSHGDAWRSVVQLEFHAGLDRPSSRCSGVIIANDAVLTAAHCVIEPMPGVISFRNLETQTVERRRVEGSAIIDSRFREDDPWEENTVKLYQTSFADVAIVMFKNGLPEGFKSALLPTTFLDLPYGERVEIFGYGLKHGQAQHDDILRVTHGSLNKAMGVTYLILAEPNSGLCDGDSGGPVFATVNGVRHLIAISSRGLYHNETCIDILGGPNLQYHSTVRGKSGVTWIERALDIGRNMLTQRRADGPPTKAPSHSSRQTN